MTSQMSNLIETDTLTTTRLEGGATLVSGGTRLQVYIGHFKTPEEAQRFVRRAQRSRYMVVREEGDAGTR